MKAGAATLARLERWLVVLVVLHSAAVGVVLLGFPSWAAVFGGWGRGTTLFFTRQGGAFHLVVAFAYLWEYRRLGGVTVLVVAKATAVVFLFGAFALGESAWAVPLSGAADGAMGAAVLALHRARLAAARRERAEPAPTGGAARPSFPDSQ
jgi:4-hydroxybenzoate polyprenyltransferase